MERDSQKSDLDTARADVEALTQLLEQEFEALKARQIGILQELDQSKTALLQRLQSHADSFLQAEMLSGQWLITRDRLRLCQEMHFRNVQLLRRQLDAVQGALQAMMGDEHTMPTLYDRLGQVNRLSGARAYQAI